MSNANRDYAIVYDVKNGLLVLSRPLIFYITDKNTSNIFVKLVTRVNVGNGIDQYTDIENASNYVLTMRVIKPNNEVKSFEATQHKEESIFQFDLTEDFKDIPGKYICELTISTIVSSRQELITSDPFSYEVKRSILSNVGEIIETEDTTVEKLLNDLEATKAELSSQIKEKADKSEIGSPLVANTISEMIDKTRIYVYVGNENGYNNGYWYSYNGSNWVPGGIYNSQGIADGQITPEKTSFFESIVTVTSKNLFNKNSDDIIQNNKLNNTGGLQESTTYNVSHLINVVNIKNIVLSYTDLGTIKRLSVNVVEYDSDLNILAYGRTNESSGAYAIQNASAVYIRFEYQIARADTVQCEIGTRFTEYEEYTTITKTQILEEYIPKQDLTNYATKQDIEDINKNISVEYLPIYKNALDDLQLSVAKSGKGLKLVFASDFHQESEEGHYKFSLVRDAGEHCDLIVLGGDNITGDTYQPNQTRDEEINNLLQIFNKFKECTTPILPVVGNHDYDRLKNVSGEYINNIMFSYISNKHNSDIKKQNSYNSTGYIDFDEYKIRVIYLNCFESFDSNGNLIDPTSTGDTINMSEETKAWLLSTALNFKDKQVPTDWGIVLVGHAPIFGDTGYAGAFSTLHRALAAIKKGQDYTYGDITYKYSEQGAIETLCYIHGHQHYDVVKYIFNLNCPSISVACMKNEQKRTNTYVDMYTAYSAPRTHVIGENIDTECFDIITIDKEGRKITCNRYGAGFSRNVPINKTT